MQTGTRFKIWGYACNAKGKIEQTCDEYVKRDGMGSKRQQGGGFTGKTYKTQKDARADSYALNCHENKRAQAL